jgi:RNA polymerase sigma-70 factor, ECF subfamily
MTSSFVTHDFDGRVFPAAVIQEATLVAAAKAGEQWAFAELCRRSLPKLSRVVYRVLKNSADTEDVLQDSFLKAYKHLHGFDEKAAFSTWVARIAINSALMALRKQRRHNVESLYVRSCETDSWNQMDFVDTATGPDELYLRRESALKLRNAIGRLPETLRSAIELQRATGASVLEISDSLNISVPAAKSRLLRGRAALRRLMTRSNRARSTASTATMGAGSSTGRLPN